MSAIYPIISVIVPIYCAEKHLVRCIESILKQTFQNFELILVDDGSIDNCPTICDEYINKDPRIKVIHKENGGVSSARNAGLAAACGKYVMFCDSDDYVDQEWCLQLYQAICLYPTAWINCNIWNVNADEQAVVHYSPEGDEPVYVKKSFFDIYCLSLSGSLWNKIYSRDVIMSNSIRFNESYKIGEDVDFNVKYYKHCNSIIFISSPLYYYCENSGSLTKTYNYSFDMHRSVFRDRIPCIEPEHLGEYCDDWIWRFVHILNDTVVSQNHSNFWQKMNYNQKMMQTEEFIYCVQHATGKKENPLFMKIIKLHNYYLFWLFQKVCKIKASLKKRTIV